MAVSRNFKNGPLSPPVAQATGDMDLSVIFFFEQVPGGGRGAGGPVAPQNGRQGRAALFKPPLPSHPSFYSLKFQKKIEKRREG